MADSGTRSSHEATRLPRRAVIVGLGAELATATHPVRAATRAPLHVASFGAVGDGRTDDRAAIRAALQALAAQGGGTLHFAAGHTYNLGENAGEANIFALDGLRDATILGHGATLRIRTTGTRTKTFLFRLTGFHNVRIAGLNARDDGTDLSVDWKGMYFVMALPGAHAATGLTIEDVTITDAVALLYVSGGPIPRASGIRVARCVAERCYYGAVFAENGDDATIDLVTRNCRRSYFPYGVSRHRVALTVHHDGTTPGANACCLIKRYARDTRDIDLRARFVGPALPFGYAVKLEQQPNAGTGPGLIGDIAITLDITAAGRPRDHMVPLGFTSYAGATEERGETLNRWDGIALSGRIPAGAPAVEARVRPRVAGTLRLPGALVAGAAAGLGDAAPGFLIRP